VRLSRVVAGILASCAATCAAPPALAVEGGTLDHATTHAVLIALGAPSAPTVRCSGTLISSNVVLTARHCISPLAETPRCGQSFGAPAGSPGDLWVTAAPWSLPSASWKHVSAWVYPDSSDVCGDDVAMVVVSPPFGSDEAIPARVALSAAAFEQAVSSRVLGVAGFGSTSPHADDSGLRRSRFDIPVRCVPGSGPSCDGALGYIDVREFTSGAGPCIGDSGAGALDVSDHATVFGVLSRGHFADERCSEGIFERTDLWRWLIAKTVLASVPAGAKAPDWAIGAFPERALPGEMCLGAESCGENADCVSFDGRRSFVCAARCSAGCGAGLRCESNVCAPGAPGAPPSGDSCSVGLPARRGAAGALEMTAAGALVLLAVSRACKRRRRA
jgi:hypothetical protein